MEIRRKVISNKSNFGQKQFRTTVISEKLSEMKIRILIGNLYGERVRVDGKVRKPQVHSRVDAYLSQDRVVSESRYRK